MPYSSGKSSRSNRRVAAMVGELARLRAQASSMGRQLNLQKPATLNNKVRQRRKSTKVNVQKEATFWPVKSILNENPRRMKYLVDWAGVNPSTGRPWTPTWEPYSHVSQDLITAWDNKRYHANLLIRLPPRKSISSSTEPRLRSTEQQCITTLPTSGILADSFSANTCHPIQPRAASCTTDGASVDAELYNDLTANQMIEDCSGPNFTDCAELNLGHYHVLGEDNILGHMISDHTRPLDVDPIPPAQVSRVENEENFGALLFELWVKSFPLFAKGPSHPAQAMSPPPTFISFPTIWSYYEPFIGFGVPIGILQRDQPPTLQRIIKERGRGLEYLHSLANCIAITKKKVCWSGDEAGARQCLEVIKAIRATADDTQRRIQEAKNLLCSLQEADPTCPA